MKTATLSIDLEQDCPPFLDTMRGIEEGLPRLLELLGETDVKATFFTTGHVAERFPGSIRDILEQGHELGCHGYSHKRFDALSSVEAEQELRSAREILLEFDDDIRSFRAPNLSFPVKYLDLLKTYNFDIDSSIAAYKPPFKRRVYEENGITRIPATLTSSVLRLPARLVMPLLKCFHNPVLFVHPWEFIDMSTTGIRYDCRFNTGTKALSYLEAAIHYLQSKHYRFTTIKERASLSH